MNLFREAGGCQADTASALDNYCYCEKSCFNIYELSVPTAAMGQKVYVIEILTGIGKEGKDYWIVRKVNNKWTMVAYFTGYLNCIIPKSDALSDIIFQSETDKGRVTIQLAPSGLYYRRKKIIDVTGTDVTPANKQQLLKEYNARPESSDIGRNEELH